MCYFALMGAEAEAFRLRAAIESVSDVFDTDVAPEVTRVGVFPPSDTIVCVTLGGCSCALVTALRDGPRRSGHATTQSAAFRAVIANVTRHFGSSRLLVYQKSAKAWDCEPRSTTLTGFLGSPHLRSEELLNIVA